MKKSLDVIKPITDLCVYLFDNVDIEKNLYKLALENNSPTFNGTVNAISNGLTIKFKLKEEPQVVSLGYLNDGKINLFVSEKGNIYAKIEGTRKVIDGKLIQVLDHLNYDEELMGVISTRLPNFFQRDLSIGIDQKYLEETNNLNFFKMVFDAKNGIFTAYVKPCLRKYNIVIYQCLNINSDFLSYLVVDKKNNLNLFFSDILELERSKIGISYKISSKVIESKPINSAYIPML
jgi:hypothetical protein